MRSAHQASDVRNLEAHHGGRQFDGRSEDRAVAALIVILLIIGRVVPGVRSARRKTEHHSLKNDDCQVYRIEHTPTMASASVTQVWTTQLLRFQSDNPGHDISSV